ncbi:hypothetical protein HRbin30_00668 [bacterium HR30]|nr:hypothetical protein HRbin30_00668 [bacterium HR30]
MTKPCSPTGPHTEFGGTKAAISKVYTGRRAEQVMNGATKMVASRSRGEAIVRVAMIPGTAQAKQESKGTKLRP